MTRTATCCSAFVAAVALGACSSGAPEEESSAPEMPAVTVAATQVFAEDFVYKVALTGQLEAEHSVVLKPEIEGVVEEIFGTEGQPVKKGETLFRLRAGEQRARLDEAQAEMRPAPNSFRAATFLRSRAKPSPSPG